MAIDQPEDVTNVPKVRPQPNRADTRWNDMQADKSFASYMNQPTHLAPGQAPVANSPFAINQQERETPSLAQFKVQAAAAHTSLDNLKTHLNTPKLQLNQSTKYRLKNQLSSANENLSNATKALGGTPLPEKPPAAGANPVVRFIGMVSNGQNQLDALQKQLSLLAERGDQLNPAEMLLVQTRLNKAQQQLEYSSILLSKAVDDFKMIMNIQL